MDKSKQNADPAHQQLSADEAMARKLQDEFDGEHAAEQHRRQQRLQHPVPPRPLPSGRSRGRAQGSMMRVDEVMGNVEIPSKPRPPPFQKASKGESSTTASASPGNTMTIATLSTTSHDLEPPKPSPCDDYSRDRIHAGPIIKSDRATLNRTLDILAFLDPSTPNYKKAVRDILDTCIENLQMGPGYRIEFNGNTTTGATTAVVTLAPAEPEDKASVQRRAEAEKEEEASMRWRDRVLTERRLLSNRKELRLRAEGAGSNWDFGRGCPREYGAAEYDEYCEWVLQEARAMEGQPKVGIAELVEQKGKEKR